MRLLTLSEMAAELECSVRVFSRDVHEKHIPFKPVGKRKKFDPAKVHAHLDNLAEHKTVSAPSVRLRAKRGRFAERLGL